MKKSEYYRKKKKNKTFHNHDILGDQLYTQSTSQTAHSDSFPFSCLYNQYDLGDLREDDDIAMLFDCDEKGHEATCKQELLSWATSLLKLSPTSKSLLKEASKDGWKLGLENLNGPDFHLDVPEKTIILDQGDLSETLIARSNYFSSTLIMSLIRALRDVWQEKRNGAFDEEFAPEAILTLERVRAADLDVIAILAAWELRCEGHNNLWRHILGSEDCDLAMRFSGYLERDPTSTFTNKALAETFTQWFRSEERVSACDHETLDYMDEIIGNADIQNPFGENKAQKIDIERLSCLPDRTAYLQHHTQSVLSSPLYAGMNDEINQSHLLHILYDTKVVRVQNVPFRDADLAERIFPDGMMTHDTSETIH